MTETRNAFTVKTKAVTATLIIIIVFQLFYCSQSYAQKYSNDSYKKFSVEAGANFSNMNFNKGVPTPSPPIPGSWNAGLIIGVLVKVPLAQNLFLEPGYFYIRRNGIDKSIDIKYSNDYVALPVLLKYKISSLIDVVAGPQVELLIHASANDKSTVTNITHDVEERSIGATAGINVHVSPFIYLAARYLHGVNHIGIGQRSANGKEFKYESASVSIGVEF